MTTFKFAGKPKAENIASLLAGARSESQRVVVSRGVPNVVEVPAAPQNSVAVYQQELLEREERANAIAQRNEGRRAAERRKVTVASNLAAIHFGNGDENEEEVEEVSDHRSGTIERASSSMRSSNWSANRSVAASKRDGQSDRGDSAVKSRKLVAPTDLVSNNDAVSETSGGGSSLLRTASTVNTGSSRATVISDTAIEKYRKEIISAISSHSVTVIRGPTGCGKSTCVPRFVLEDARTNSKPVKIVVTEPRRIAALSLAQRICDVEGWQIGSVCGYQVGLEPNIGPDTLLTYCTTGVLLEKLIYASADSDDLDFTHIIVDEVHERDIEIELLLLILHYLIDKRDREKKDGFKLILMSATMPSDIIQQFSTVWNDDEIQSDMDDGQWHAEHNARRVAQINVVERRHDVAVSYLNKFAPTMCNEMSIEHVQFKKDEAAVDSALYDVAARLIASFDEDEKREMRRATAISGWSTLASVSGTPLPNVGTTQTIVRGAVLVFVPGYYDIIRLSKKLRERDLADRLHLVIVPLHSSIPLEEQRSVFSEVSKHERKVIIATNIAQSSITVADVKYVIDFCLEKRLVCDRQSQFTGLQLCWASKSAMEQRRGRAGRVADGTCYRLIPDCLFEELDADESPAVKRVPLERTVLKIKVWDRVSPWCLLRRSEHGVDKWQVAQAILSLKEVGALTLESTPATVPSTMATTARHIDSLLDGVLTYVGYVLASLPIDVHAGRLVLLGHAFGVLRDAVIIAAGMQSRSVFSMPFQAELESFESKLNWSAGSYSDLLALRNAYLLWKRKRHLEFTRRSEGGTESFDYDAERRWCKQHFLQLRDLHEMDKLVTEIQTRLKRHSMYFDFIESAESKSESSEQPAVQKSFTRRRRQDDFILKVCIAGAFYPYYFVRPFDPALEHGAAKQLNDLDPQRTVALHGLPQDSGCLYREQLAERFARSYGAQFVTLRKPLVVVRDTHAFVHFHDYVGRRGPTSVDERYYMHASGCLDVPTPVLLALKMGDLARIELLRFDAAFAHDAASEYHRIEQLKQRHAVIRRRLERADSDANADADNESCMIDACDAASAQTSMTLTSNCETEYAAYERAAVAVPNPATLSHKWRVRVFVESVIDCASLYVRLYTGLPLQQTINEKLNELGEHGQLRHLEQSTTAKMREHQLCVAHFSDENGESGWYRAQIRALDWSAGTADVYFIDYGNEETRSFGDLFELPDAVSVRRFPWQVFRFVVSHVRPSALICGQAWPTSDTLWLREKLAHFSSGEQRSAMLVELFSVVDNVARGDFIIRSLDGEISIKEELIQRRVAQRSEEPFASRTWHSQRTKAAGRSKQAGAQAAGDTDSLFDAALRDSGPSVYSDNWSMRTKQETQSECTSDVMDVQALIDQDERDDAARVYPSATKCDTFGRFNSLTLQRPGSPMSVSCRSNSRSFTRSRTVERELDADAKSADIDEDKLRQLEQDIDHASYDLEMRIAAKYDELRQRLEARQPARNVSASATALRFATAPASGSSAAKAKQETITLTGPDHPLRLKFKPVMRTLQKASVRVDRGSLNAVAIDTEPQTRCERVLIAGNVSNQSEGRAVSLRWTTLMPAIPCFAPLVALMFAPTAELRIDDPIKPTRYTGVLSGLGFDEQRRMPLLPDHDLEFVFDAAVEHEDLVAINRLRSVLNVLFGSEGLRDQAIRQLERDRLLKGVERDEEFKKRRLAVLRECGWDSRRVFKWQALLRQLVIKILSRDRNSVTRCEPPRLFEWGIVPRNLLMTSAFATASSLLQDAQRDGSSGMTRLGLDAEQQRAACHYPNFIRELQLINLKRSEKPMDTIQDRQLRENIDRLHKTSLLEALVTNTVDKRVFHCPICDETVERSCGFLVHINDASHIHKRSELERTVNAAREQAALFAARHDRFGSDVWFSSLVDAADQELPPPDYNDGESFDLPLIQPRADVRDRLGTEANGMFEPYAHFSNSQDNSSSHSFERASNQPPCFNAEAARRAQPTPGPRAFASNAPYHRERAGWYPPAAPRDCRLPYDGRGQPFSQHNLPPPPLAASVYRYPPAPQGYFPLAVPQQTIVNSTSVTYNIHFDASPSSSAVSDQPNATGTYGNRADLHSVSVRREQHQMNALSPQSDYPPFGASVQPLTYGRATTTYTYSYGRGRGRGRGEALHHPARQMQQLEYESGPGRVTSEDRRGRQFGFRWNERSNEVDSARSDQYSTDD